MIKITETDKAIEVQFEGKVSDVVKDIWAILEAYRDNLGTGHTLEFIEAYLEYLNGKIEGEHHD